MSKLVIVRGLPGCGKSTAARIWVTADPDNRAEVNRDAIRMMLGGFEVGTPAQEKMVTTIQHQAIRDLLKSGVDVISSDTNLKPKYVRELYKIGNSLGADIAIMDMTDVPLAVVHQQNRARRDKNPVPDAVINRMYSQDVKDKGYPLPLPDLDSAGKGPDFHVAPFGAPRAIIVDVDGTVASCVGVRSPYDYSRVSEDKARRGIINIVRMAYEDGAAVLFVSGRPDINNVRADTEDWIRKCVRVPFKGLFMRPADRLQINDAIIKRDLFDQYIRNNYDIEFVLDDRDRVVRMWREELGLDCLQVNYGDF